MQDYLPADQEFVEVDGAGHSVYFEKASRPQQSDALFHCYSDDFAASQRHRLNLYSKSKDYKQGSYRILLLAVLAT